MIRTVNSSYKQVEFSGTELDVKCSAINRSNNTDHLGKGWDRVGNVKSERIVAASETDNWRTCVILDKSKLTGKINGPVVAVILSVTPKSGLTCQPFNTQAVLTSRKYASSGSESLLNNNWCTQGSISDSTGSTRKGDTGLNFDNSGTQGIFGNNRMVSAQRACEEGKDGFSIIKSKYSKYDKAPTLNYIFADNVNEPNAAVGGASSGSRINYGQGNQSLESLFSSVMKSENSRDNICFYLTRYDAYAQDGYTKLQKTLGYAGWIYSQYDNWKVTIFYRDEVEVDLPVYVNGKAASNDTAFINYIKNGKVSIECDTSGSISTYAYAKTIKVPYGSKLRLKVGTNPGFIVANGSYLNITEWKDVAEEMNISLNLSTNLSLNNPAIGTFDSKATLYSVLSSKYYGENVNLPILPSVAQVSNSYIPGAVYSGCGAIGDLSDQTQTKNEDGKKIAIPDVYTGAWSNVQLPLAAALNIYGPIYRQYKCSFNLYGIDGNKIVLPNNLSSRTFSYSASSVVNEGPADIYNVIQELTNKYPGVSFSHELTKVGDATSSTFSNTTWHTIWGAVAPNDVNKSNANSTPIPLAVDIHMSLPTGNYYCYYKSNTGELYRALYKDENEKLYDVVVKQ